MTNSLRRPVIATDSDTVAGALTALIGAGSWPRPPLVRQVGAGSLAAPPGEEAILAVPTTSALLTARAAHDRLYVVDETGDTAGSVRRLVDLVTNARRVTPSRAEYGMHAAYGAALRSAAWRGGVGAALTDDRGDVVALGTAEVPAYGGGQYWEGDPGDARDIRLAGDPATAVRLATVETLLDLLAAGGVSLPGPAATVAADLLAAFDKQQGSHGVGHGGAAAQTFESLGRVVHAEMAALLTAARNRLDIGGSTMYVTASSCRQCLRHLVCAGLRQIVYFGPRLDSAPPFHADSVDVRADAPGRLRLTPFTGVGPGAYQALFGAQMREFSVARI
ncbi:MAG TPA: deaminase [Actinophytocola sp.]|uniref:deaminase n=1 Tax=Actinophytocola sp. TaxID=1872138 RepID=UPI002DDD903F|nr:deaminase [Actinophytocola sp.]HEV2778229.1 deaminase [Actinophytocola sp.]